VCHSALGVIFQSMPHRDSNQLDATAFMCHQ
jgi:hypothetical protein